MKRVFALVLMLALTLMPTLPRALCEKVDPDKVAYQALELFASVLMCPDIESFEDMPSEELAWEAILAYRLVGDDQGMSDEEIYKTLFAEGEYTPLYEIAENIDPSLLPVEIEIDSAIDCGGGLVKVSLTVYADAGDGYEFYCLVDIYLRPDPAAVHGSRIARVFFPE